MYYRPDGGKLEVVANQLTSSAHEKWPFDLGVKSLDEYAFQQHHLLVTCSTPDVVAEYKSVDAELTLVVEWAVRIFPADWSQPPPPPELVAYRAETQVEIISLTGQWHINIPPTRLVNPCSSAEVQAEGELHTRSGSVRAIQLEFEEFDSAFEAALGPPP